MKGIPTRRGWREALAGEQSRGINRGRLWTGTWSEVTTCHIGQVEGVGGVSEEGDS